MRPVIRGNHDPGLIFIDLTTMATLKSTLDSYTAMFKQKTPVYKLFLPAPPKPAPKTVSVTYWQLFNDILLDLAKFDSKEVKKRSLNFNEKTEAKGSFDRVVDRYQEFYNKLLERMGHFCAYCDTPDLPLMAVEHIVPKSQYPLFTLAWENFVLACSICNSIKKDQPPREQVAFDLHGNPLNKAEPEYRDDIRQEYLYPDQPEAYRALVPRLDAWLPPPPWPPQPWPAQPWPPAQPPVQPNISYREVPITEATRTESFDLAVNPATEEVWAKLYLGTPAPAPPVNPCWTTVQVLMVPNNVASQAEQERARKTADDLVKLNRVVNTTQKTDTRLLTRTKAWFLMLGWLHSLDQLKNDQQNWERTWQTTLFSVASLGQFSLWVRMLHQGNFVDHHGTQLIARFKVDVNQGIFPRFPGTDFRQVP